MTLLAAEQEIERLRTSSVLPEILAPLNELLLDEARRREQFFHDITEDMKAEFINGKVTVLSPSTEKNDRGVKFSDYEAHGVDEYWIVDPEQQTVEQYVLRAGKYSLLAKAASGEVVSEVIVGLRLDRTANFASQPTV